MMEEALRFGNVKAGEVLAGKYRVERVLGQGGMGVVVEATHLQLEERVALKFLLPELASNPEASARFLREARSAVKIRSEHVAKVLDVGTLEHGTPYMVMEFLDGNDLADQLRTGGPLPVTDAVDYVLQACEALAEAHKMGIVHRDLKPANLFVTRRADRTPLVKLLDFGISKVTNPGANFSITKTSSLMGSPLYMAPEQMQSARNAEVASDIWALGVILYELVAGQPPFHGETLPELICAVVQEQAVSLTVVRPEVPPELDAAVLRCLEKNPSARPANVAELAQALAPFASAHGQRSVERVSMVLEVAPGQSAPPPQRASQASIPDLNPATAISNPGGTQHGWGQTASPARSSRVPLVVVGALATLLIVVGVVAAAIWSKASAVAAEASSAMPAASGMLAASEAAPPSEPSSASKVATSVETALPSASAVPGAPEPPVALTATAKPVAPKPTGLKSTSKPSPKPNATKPKPVATDTSGFGDRE